MKMNRLKEVDDLLQVTHSVSRRAGIGTASWIVKSCSYPLYHLAPLSGLVCATGLRVGTRPGWLHWQESLLSCQHPSLTCSCPDKVWAPLQPSLALLQENFSEELVGQEELQGKGYPRSPGYTGF
jgi:hypothetical protein